MSKIIRTKTKAGGGTTSTEKKKLNAHAKLWIDRITRTDPIEPDKIIPVIKELYKISGLKEPRVIIVPSPFVAYLAGGIAAAVWHLRKVGKSTRAATYSATRAATYAATRAATDDATDEATRDATREATRAATYAATDAATDAATYDATYDATDEATDDATDAATRDATYDATREATYAATDAATDAATYAATYDATRAATRDATRAATRAATRDATEAATDDATEAATYSATRAATEAATYSATYSATRAATYSATRAATEAATYSATRDATEAAMKKNWLRKLIEIFTPNAVEFSLGCIKLSYRMYQGGNMWGQFDSYLTAMRDVIGLTGLDCWDKYKVWEEAAIHGSWRIMHPEFCLVSDFPEILKKDERNRPHSVTGPSHRWRDGFEIYYIQGVRMDKKLWEKIVNDKMSAREVFALENMEQRRIAYEMMDKKKMLDLDSEILDEIKNDGYGNPMKIIKFSVKGFIEPFIFLVCTCPSTGRVYHLQTDKTSCNSAKMSSFGLEDNITFSHEW